MSHDEDNLILEESKDVDKNKFNTSSVFEELISSGKITVDKLMEALANINGTYAAYTRNIPEKKKKVRNKKEEKKAKKLRKIAKESKRKNRKA